MIVVKEKLIESLKILKKQKYQRRITIIGLEVNIIIKFE